jgi:hypothetical protein
MNCDILRILYVKANGEIVCNDDYGERVNLGFIPDGSSTESIHDVLTNRRYQRIRDAFAAGSVPWPGTCEKCSLLRHHEVYSNDLLRNRNIEKLQIEASLACALKCPACCNLDQLRSRKGPLHLAPEVPDTLLSDLRNQRYKIQSIEYCGQGEPLNNPNFAELVATARRIYPQTIQRIITNGNHDYRQNSEPSSPRRFWYRSMAHIRTIMKSTG